MDFTGLDSWRRSITLRFADTEASRKSWRLRTLCRTPACGSLPFFNCKWQFFVVSMPTSGGIEILHLCMQLRSVVSVTRTTSDPAAIDAHRMLLETCSAPSTPTTPSVPAWKEEGERKQGIGFVYCIENRRYWYRKCAQCFAMHFPINCICTVSLARAAGILICHSGHAWRESWSRQRFHMRLS